jgi:hypothetical protein
MRMLVFCLTAFLLCANSVFAAADFSGGIAPFQAMQVTTSTDYQYRIYGDVVWQDVPVGGFTVPANKYKFELFGANEDYPISLHDTSGLQESAFPLPLTITADSWFNDFEKMQRFVYTTSEFSEFTWIPVSVPEPSTIMLGGIGLLFLVKRSRK